MENPIKIDDLGGTPIFGNTHKYKYEYIYIYTYKLYGCGLCKGIPIPKKAENKVQYRHFRYLKLLVN